MYPFFRFSARYSSRAFVFSSLSGYILWILGLLPGSRGISWSHRLCSGSPVSSSSLNSLPYCRYSSGIRSDRTGLGSLVITYILRASFDSFEGVSRFLELTRFSVTETLPGVSHWRWPVHQLTLGLLARNQGIPSMTSFGMSITSSVRSCRFPQIQVGRCAVSISTHPCA